MATVAITDHPFPHLDAARAVLEPAGHDVVEHDCSTAEEVARACADADGVLNTYAPMPTEVIDALRRCRGIARFGIGVDTIDLDRATARGKAAEQLRSMLAGERPTYLVNAAALQA